MKVVIDPILLNGSHGNLILDHLHENNLKSEVKTQIVPGVVSWQRMAYQSLMGDELRLTDKIEEQDQILYFLMGEELIKLIKNGELVSTIKELKEIFPGKSVTLLIFGLKEYCRVYKDVERKLIERSLTEVELYTGCSHRLLETSADLSSTIYQFSKAVAEEPYKYLQTKLIN